MIELLPLASGQECCGMAFPTHLIAVTRSSLPLLWEQGIPQEGEDDRWVRESIVLRNTAPYRTCKQNASQRVTERNKNSRP